MKKRKQQNHLREFGRKNIHLAVYIAVCLAGVIILISFFNRLISNHDRVLSQQTCSLITEKVTSSLGYLADEAADMSVIAANDDTRHPEDIYEELSRSKRDARFSSVGLIYTDGSIYAAESEKLELEKQGILDDARTLTGVTISKPYRSVMNGQIVFTVLSNIIRDGEKIGCLFVTYDFSRIIELSYSDNIDSSAEVWLMETQSLNIIRCSGPKSELNGNWGNLKLNEEISKNDDYMDCISQMRKGADTASVTYTENDEKFTQVFKKISDMEGWCVVVRILNKTFSSTMLDFRFAVVIFAALTICATAYLFLSFRARAEKEKKALESLTREVIKAFATAVDFNDPYTAGHSRRVGEYSREIAKRLGMKEDECRDVYYSGLLHDVGKLGIDNTIINKPSSLSDKEFAEIKKHPDMGYEILKDISLRESYALGAKYHHERVDGKGYPSHEKEIPLVGRIISVADAYDAMTSKRSYRDALPQAAVREQIEKNIGTQFDEKIAKIMLEMIDEDKNYDMRQK